MSLALQRRCSGCHRPFDGHPVFVRDTAFCCAACAGGGLCACFVDADLADDGVDGLGLAFGEPSRAFGEPGRVSAEPSLVLARGDVGARSR